MAETHEVPPDERRRMQAEIQREQPTGYTLADYEKAKAEFEAAEQRYENYSGNNPNKWVKERNAARRHLENVREYLKRRGILVEG